MNRQTRRPRISGGNASGNRKELSVMYRHLKWKIAVLVFAILFSGVTVMPSFTDSLPGWWTKYLAPAALNLGLDLQGGMHLVLKVDIEKAKENTLELAAQDLKQALADKHISLVRTPGAGSRHEIVFTIPNTGAIDEVKKELDENFSSSLTYEIKHDKGSFPRIHLRLSKEKSDFIDDNAINQSLEVIRNRIDQFGVAEPVIVRQGTDEIVVQLPGVKDPERALRLIGQTAQLEFKLLYEEKGIDLNGLISQVKAAGKWKEGDGRRKLNIALEGKLPPNTEVYFEKRKDPQTGIERVTPLLIKSPVMMTGDMVQDARVMVGGTFNEPYVSLDLTGRGGRIFGEITERNVGKRFAIILDEMVKSAPVIQEKILGGRAQITGNFTYEEANDLAIVLRVGALPAPVEIVQNLTVGASLGRDSIQKGLMSGLLGAAMVLVFMIVYYRVSGLIADFALMLNVLLLFAGLATMNATLTLPGIAGIILSIGMGVDSNVLIFERMREEFAINKGLAAGIDSGYAMAFWSIVDSQVTTLITAMALFLFGTGPIKGFAVTLSFGIIFNLFTTLFGTRLIYDILIAGGRLKKLTFMSLVGKPKVDFMSIRKITFTISTVMVLIGLFAFVQIIRGKANLGVDFSGGTIVQYKAEKPFTLKEVRKALADAGIKGAMPQQVENENRLIVKFKKSRQTVGADSERITAALNKSLADKGFQEESRAEIGSSISTLLREKAIEAIIISLAGVLLYLAFRFDFRFGVAAAAATFHDVVVVLGLCYLLNVEMTLLIVTALLTLAGYSLNDSVVVFDRIRENMKKMKGSSFVDIINRSINDTLARTSITSLTTLLVLVALFVWGGSVIHDFSFALLSGIIVGTYSSIFIASPLLDVLGKRE